MSHRVIQASQAKFTVKSPVILLKGSEYPFNNKVVLVNYCYFSVSSNCYLVNISVKRS